MNEPSPFGKERLLAYFTDHLNRICCAKTHLVKRLPEASGLASFRDIRNAVDETREDVVKQIERMNEIFQLLGAEQSDEPCYGMITLLDEALQAIHHHADDAALRDMAILFYLQNIESIEQASFQVLQMAAVRLHDKRISQLLKENHDESKEDRALLLLLTSKYLMS
jgi:ferritin-like metal-binding protein YciE